MTQEKLITINIPILLIEYEDKYLLSTTSESEKILTTSICVEGDTLEKVEEAFQEALQFTNEYHLERSNELNKWKIFQKGNWSQTGGCWFIIYGIKMYFRKGKGMKGGKYIPFTSLNISVYNFWGK